MAGFDWRRWFGLDKSAPKTNKTSETTNSELDLSGLVLSGASGRLPLSAIERQQFVILQRVNRYYLLVSDRVFGTSTALTMRQRVIQNLGIKADQCEVIKASDETIARVYANDPVELARKSGARSGADSFTRPEKFIDEMVSAAALAGTSDIHIESRVNQAFILFRINGVRQVYKELTHGDALSMGYVMYGVYADAASKETTWNPAEVVDGAFPWETRDRVEYQLRFSSSPIHPNGGFHIVLRLLKLTAGGGLQLSQVGYSPEQLEEIVAMTTSRKGLVLLCGATNSGKSTSIQAIIRNVFAARGKHIKLITVEDPVEYVIEGACQIPVARRKSADQESNFTRALNGTLRQDPDFVMVGEIRDEESALVTQNLGLAGRKLMATLHTNSALEAFTRLDKIGLQLDVTTSPNFISGVIYQSLVPVLCSHCKVPWNDETIAGFENTFIKRVMSVADTSLIRLKGNGCDHCKHTGITGLTICAEVLTPTRELLSLLWERNGINLAEKMWRDNGGMRIIDHAKTKMLQGLISPVDVEANIENFKVGE